MNIGGAARPGACDVFITSAGMGASRQWTKGDRFFKKFESRLANYVAKFGRFRADRNNMPNRKGFFGNMQSEIATAGNIKLVGEYGRRRSGRSPVGKLACFECGDTRRLMNECPIYLDNVKRYNIPKG